MTDKTDEKEIYKPVKYENFGDFYDVSNCGNVKSKLNNHLLKQSENNGYLYVSFYKPYSKRVSVSRIVALTFIENDSKENDVVNHIDENKHNNHYLNLEWTTQKDNVNKSTKDKTHSRVVIQKDISGNIIREFLSVTDASKNIGVDRTTIGKALVGENQTAGGFKWEYKDPTNNPMNNVDLSDSISLKFISNSMENYFVYKNGEIFNKSRRLFLKHCINAKGAHYVSLNKDNKKKNFYIHQLVAMCYLPNPQGKSRIKHKDKNNSNNSVENLEWW